MSAGGRRPDTSEPATAPRRYRWFAGALIALLLAAAAVLVLVHRGSGDGGSAAAAVGARNEAQQDPVVPTDPGRSVPLSSTVPSAVPAAVMADVPGLPPKLRPVALDTVADYGDGVHARLTGIKAFDAHGTGPGEISGPALAVTVELTNDSGAAISLDTAAVNVYRGAEGARASTMHDGATAPFSGRLAAGANVRATYAFSVPADQRKVITVTVGTSPATGTAVFSGAVS